MLLKKLRSDHKTNGDRTLLSREGRWFFFCGGRDLVKSSCWPEGPPGGLGYAALRMPDLHERFAAKRFVGPRQTTDRIRIRIRISFIGQVCLHIRGICYSDWSSTVQQNDSDRTGLRQQKNNIQIGNTKNTIYNTDNYVWGLTCKFEMKNNKYVWWINNQKQDSWFCPPPDDKAMIYTHALESF